MSVHVVELDLVQSNANRAFLIGYLLGVIHTTKASLEGSSESLSADIELRLKEIYPLIQKEFPGTNLVPSEL